MITKKLSNEELKDILRLISLVKRLTGKDKTEEIIKNHMLLDILLELDRKGFKKEAKIIENILLNNMKKNLEEDF